MVQIQHLTTALGASAGQFYQLANFETDWWFDGYTQQNLLFYPPI